MFFNRHSNPWPWWLLSLTFCLVSFDLQAQPKTCRAAASAIEPLRVVQSTPIYRHDANVFNVTDAANSFFRFQGFLFDGHLEIAAFLVDDVRGLRSSWDGKTLYRQMMAHFKGENIEVIEGHWRSGTNLNQFLIGVENGLSLEAAALQTWSGKMARVFGFSEVKSVRILPRQIPESTFVQV